MGDFLICFDSHLHEGLRRSLEDGGLQFGHGPSSRRPASCSRGAVRLLYVLRQRGLRQEPHGALVAEEGVVPLWKSDRTLKSNVRNQFLSFNTLL